jgi:molybdate transport system ATP-binding protein
MTALSLSVRMCLEGFELDIEHSLPLAGISALFGPSGSGKSSLLRIIAGLERRARGRIAFGDELWQNADSALFVPAHRRGVGYVFQDARLFSHLTVEGNLRFADKRSRTLDGAIAFDDVVAALELAPLLARRCDALSGGERQRVAIGRTLLTRPRLLLMDEPLVGLDLKRKAEILPYIEALPDAFRVSVVYVTHAIEEVTRLAERMIVLAAGRKVAEGLVEDVLERLDLHTAMGHFEAGVVLTTRVLRHDLDYQLTLLDHHGQTIAMPRVAAEEGSEIRLRVRARDVALATQRPEWISVRNILSGRVSEIVEEPHTAFAEVLVDIGGARLRSRLTRQAVAELELEIGKPVFALVKSVTFDRRGLSLTHARGRMSRAT